MDSRIRRRPHRFTEEVEIDAAWRPDGGPRVHVALVEPEIPQNTGTIVRLCACAACPLHLVEPLGFDIDERAVRRAGLDYWEHAHVSVHESLEKFHETHAGARMWYTTKKADRAYTEVDYADGDILVFGRETSGLPDELLEQHADRAIGIPMFGPVRSINLANAVSIVLYEALRQTRGF
jgi:tRNA (cytidine/uridine-2'-O-)-methyltransferase